MEDQNQGAPKTPETAEEIIARFREEVALLKAENNQQKEEIQSLKEKIEILDIAHKDLLNQLVDAQFDELTGLRRRGPFELEINDILKIGEKSSRLENEYRKNRIEMPTIALVVFDVDYFKQINDTYGHDVGDEVLKKIAEIIQENTREIDISSRWGGEEIILAMIGANEEEAKKRADLIREKIKEARFPSFPDLNVTISAGIASSDKFSKFPGLFEAADKALYESKNNGRNQVTIYSDSK